MSSKQIKISDTFEQSTCGVCGCCEINQYFTINDNFIEYSGTFISLREVLKEALDLKVDTKSLEICLDCKDKVIKFYHFKRKVHDAQKTKHFRPGRSPRQKEKRSKVVHSIVKIVEDYTEKCSVSTIKVDENSRKLIIEPKVHPAAAPTTTITSHTKHASATRSLANENDELLDEMFVETPTFDTSENMMADPVNIKQEEVFGEPINYIDPSDTSNMQDDNDDMGDDDSNYNDPDYSYNYGASTSSQAFPPVSKKRKTDANKSSNEGSVSFGIRQETRGAWSGGIKKVLQKQRDTKEEEPAFKIEFDRTNDILGWEDVPGPMWRQNFEYNEETKITRCKICGVTTRGMYFSNMKVHLNAKHTDIALSMNASIKKYVEDL